jgi:hypothetical protein
MTRTQDYLLIVAGLAVLAILASPWAEARTYADRTLSWECPTTRTDGSAFACVTDAAGYDLETTLPAGNAPTIIELPATATSRIINADPAGTLYRLRVCDLAGQCSEWSAQVKKPANPKKITTFAVQ